MLNADEISARLKYDATTGRLFWRAREPKMFTPEKLDAEFVCRRWNARFANKEAFTAIDNKRGYRVGSIFKKRYQAHRIIWLMYHGELPNHEIDHINGIRTDNRIENLRDVTHKENMKNQRLRSTNTSGVTGVSIHSKSGKWVAQIKVNGDAIYLGSFAQKDDAVSARKKAEHKYGFFANHGLKRGVCA